MVPVLGLWPESVVLSQAASLRLGVALATTIGQVGDRAEVPFSRYRVLRGLGRTATTAAMCPLLVADDPGFSLALPAGLSAWYEYRRLHRAAALPSPGSRRRALGRTRAGRTCEPRDLCRPSKHQRMKQT